MPPLPRVLFPGYERSISPDATSISLLLFNISGKRFEGVGGEIAEEVPGVRNFAVAISSREITTTRFVVDAYRPHDYTLLYVRFVFRCPACRNFYVQFCAPLQRLVQV